MLGIEEAVVEELVLAGGLEKKSLCYLKPGELIFSLIFKAYLRRLSGIGCSGQLSKYARHMEKSLSIRCDLMLMIIATQRQSRLINGSSGVCRKYKLLLLRSYLCLASMPPRMKSQYISVCSILKSRLKTHLNHLISCNSGES